MQLVLRHAKLSKDQSQFLSPTSGGFVLSFVAQDQTNISADSLGVAIVPPFTEVLGPAALYICVLDGLHFDLVGLILVVLDPLLLTERGVLAFVIVARWVERFGFVVSIAFGLVFAHLTVVTGRWLFERKEL